MPPLNPSMALNGGAGVVPLMHPSDRAKGGGGMNRRPPLSRKKALFSDVPVFFSVAMEE